MTGFLAPMLGVGGIPRPWREFAETALEVAVDKPGEHVGEVGGRIDAVQLAALDQRGQDRPVLGAFIRAGEQGVLAVQRNRPVILPISGRRSRSGIAGTLSMVAASGASGASSAEPGRLFTSRRRPGWSLWPRRGSWIRSPALEWRSAHRGWRHRRWMSCIAC